MEECCPVCMEPLIEDGEGSHICVACGWPDDDED
jgi:hypothetical protein